jgi:hypothetical protein
MYSGQQLERKILGGGERVGKRWEKEVNERGKGGEDDDEEEETEGGDRPMMMLQQSLLV